MASYLMFFRFTHQGLRNIKESPDRVEAARKTLSGLGITVRQFFALMGHYDTLFIVEGPDDETVTSGALSIAGLGNVHTETYRAFTEDEFRTMVRKVAS
ncbi:MAG: GYD domain-containing protein [Dehalococcoidia bacterium]|nr:GYD domain-containing protein [Dehalococcoidia bacterium]